MKKKIGIIGASGFTGRELAGLLKLDEYVEIVFLSSRSFAGKINRESQIPYEDLDIEAMIARQPDCIFFCTPHGVAMKMAPQFLQHDIKVVDLSADFRFRDPQVFSATYGIPYQNPPIKPVYGLVEWFAPEIKTAALVANPGCYVTGALTALLPVAEYAEWAVFDGKSGYSGAGADNALMLQQKLQNNSYAYKITNHRHEAEIQQFVEAPIFFTPHLLPFFRGMEVTAHLKIKPQFQSLDFFALFQKVYADYACVEICPKIPEIAEVQHSNQIMLGGFEVDKNGRLVISAVLDNLRKGAASQALQNLHLMFGLPQIDSMRTEIITKI